MYFRKFAPVVGVTALLLGSTAAHALTGDEIWASWQDTATKSGLTLAAESVASEGGVLKLTGLSLKQSVPTEGLNLDVSLAEVTMTDNSDGSVAITTAPEMKASYGAEGGVFGHGAMTIVNEGLAVTAKSEGGVTTYDYAVPKQTVTGDFSPPPVVDDMSMEVVPGVFTFSGETLDQLGSYVYTTGSNDTLGVKFTAGKTTHSTQTKAIDGTIVSDQTGEVDTMAGDSTITFGATQSLFNVKTAADFLALMNDGLAISAVIDQGATRGTTKELNPMFAYEVVTNGQPSKISLSFDKTGLGMSAASTGGDAAFTSPMVPVPVNAVFGPVSIDFRMPIMGNEAQDFKFLLGLESLTLNEEVWAMVDAGATLPRDPLMLKIDTSGKAVFDVFGMIAAEEAGTEPSAPAIDSLSISAMNLSVAGASVAATGNFTFDNSMGVPVPAGVADVQLDGANGLMDKLVALGLLPQQQVDSARMMMGMFFKPGNGDDSLVTAIEAKEDGSIFVNGMQIQ
ncbi:DUF2125 domain-containing protein [Neogemmobacter tilapiae]|uniref:DUF2125 domain-containing protein n=1 Tax=Neogemmobacter tilapiae TaxID=875041 RepID=A0A918WHL5_9RHOB|nr:DUF2125 domain-containing protein [Gemmobacter tilapiae]GHC47248.1 hypothetical protein GCM10007315_06220 [Gemmobacter tilapiae]